jgi:hypothetical protein
LPTYRKDTKNYSFQNGWQRHFIYIYIYIYKKKIWGFHSSEDSYYWYLPTIFHSVITQKTIILFFSLHFSPGSTSLQELCMFYVEDTFPSWKQRQPSQGYDILFWQVKLEKHVSVQSMWVTVVMYFAKTEVSRIHSLVGVFDIRNRNKYCKVWSYRGLVMCCAPVGWPKLKLNSWQCYRRLALCKLLTPNDFLKYG